MNVIVDQIDRARALFRAGQGDASLRLLEAALRDGFGCDAERLRALLLVASIFHEERELPSAFETCQQAMSLAQQLGDSAAQAEALCVQAGVSRQLGLAREAMDEAAASLALARTHGHAGIEARALFLMSNQALDQGDEAEAERLLNQSLACARQAGDDEREFWALNNLSNLLGIQAAREAAAGRQDAARPLVQALVQVVKLALQVAGRTGHRLHHAFAVSNLADAYIVEGDHARARQLVQEYVGIARECGFQRLLAYANLDEVRMLRAEGLPDAAVVLIDGQAHRDLLPGNEDLAFTTEKVLYELHKQAGRFEAALAHLERVNHLDTERLTRKAQQQVKVMMARLDLAQERAAAERARLDAELNAQRAQVLELEREQLRRAAHEDVLTGTGNRRAADLALELLRADPAAPGQACVVMLDIDHFKQVNDRHGHAVGDAVLSALGPLIQQGLRKRDQVFRYGGEEFLLILAEAALGSAREVCERLRLAIESHPWACIAPGLAVTASFGAASCVEQEPLDRWLQRADQALYEAKRCGRNQVALA